MRPRDFSTVHAVGESCESCGGGKHLLRNPIINRCFNLGLIALHYAELVAVLCSNRLSCINTQEACVERHNVVT